MPPQPRSNDRAITLPFVPGGPEPSTKGFSNFIPLTVMLRSVTSPPGVDAETAGLTRRIAAFNSVYSTRAMAEKTITHWIDGKLYDRAAERHGDVFNPATGEVQAKVAFASPGVVDEAVDAATGAAETWRSVSIARRTKIL